jgi:hypothetical protein
MATQVTATQVTATQVTATQVTATQVDHEPALQGEQGTQEGGKA